MITDPLHDGVLDNLEYAAHDDLQIGQLTLVRPQTLKRLIAELRTHRAAASRASDCECWADDNEHRPFCPAASP